MHIAQFVHRYPPALGGAEAWLARLSTALVADGHQVCVWTTTALDLAAFWARGQRETAPGQTTENGVVVQRFPMAWRGFARKYCLKALSLIPVRRWQAHVLPWSPQSPAWWRALQSDTAKPDVVHASAFPYASVLEYARVYARRHDVPLVLTPFVHLGDIDDPRNRIRRVYTAPYLRRFLRCADRILVQTPTEADAIAALGVPTARLVLQGLGVEPSECTGGDRHQTRGAWGVGDTVVLGHLANQSYEKGTIDLVEAAHAAVQRGTRLRLVLAGTQMPGFQAFAARLGAAPWLTQLGPLDEAGKRAFFAGIDAFVMPSRSDSFGLVFLEAWANGVPVVGYRAGGVVDVIRHEQDGLLLHCGAIAELATALTRLAQDHESRRAWGAAGQARLARDFRWADKLAIAKRTLCGPW